MAQWIEVTAPSVDAARERALDLLGITLDEAEIEVLAEPERQLFGLRRTDARLRARVRPTAPRPKQERAAQRRRRERSSKRPRTPRADSPAGASSASPDATRGDGSGQPSAGSETGSPPRRRRRRAGRQTGRGPDTGRDATPAEPTVAVSTAAVSTVPVAAEPPATATHERPTPTRRRRVGPHARRITRPNHALAQEASVDTDLAAYEEQAGTVGEFLEGLIEAFGLQGQVRVGEVDGEDVEIDIDGDDLGLLIGPHGQTMMALHELSKTVLQRTAPSGPRVRLRLDVAGYRQRRREALAQFVKAQAADVVATGQARALEPMNASDRKVVHDTINELDGVGTVSEGDEPRRRVVIVPE
jgi:spoIIIJ-associated protein